MLWQGCWSIAFLPLNFEISMINRLKRMIYFVWHWRVWHSNETAPNGISTHLAVQVLTDPKQHWRAWLKFVSNELRMDFNVLPSIKSVWNFDWMWLVKQSKDNWVKWEEPPTNLYDYEHHAAEFPIRPINMTVTWFRVRKQTWASLAVAFDWVHDCWIDSNIKRQHLNTNRVSIDMSRSRDRWQFPWI